MGRTKPAVPATWDRVDGWSGLLPELRTRLQPDDLVMVLSARRGTLAWTPKLERLPRQLAGLVPESFLMVYPPEGDAVERARPADAGDAPGIAPERIVRLEQAEFEAALRTLLGSAFHDSQSIDSIASLLVRSEREFSSEILPGVVLPHVRVRGLEAPVLLLGISPEGVRFPRTAEPARLVFLLISPKDRPDQHLKQLAEIARFVGNPEQVEALLQRHAPETPIDWLHAQNV